MAEQTREEKEKAIQIVSLAINVRESKIMKLRNFLSSASLFVVLMNISMPAQACSVPDVLTRKDYAAADIVFEGTVKAIHPTIRSLTWAGETREQIMGLDITFNIDKLVKGHLEHHIVRVSWKHGTFGYPDSVKRFHDRYGENVRVGLISPEAMTDSCNRRMNSRRKTETGFEIDIVDISCNHNYTGGNSKDPRTELPANQPFILNGFCTGPYMIPLTSRRDDPSRDLSKSEIEGENLLFQNYAEVEDFVRPFLKANPDVALNYDAKLTTRKYLMDEFTRYGNIDQKNEDDETQHFLKRTREIFEREIKWYKEREARALKAQSSERVK